MPELHECQYCRAMTEQSDDECYRKRQLEQCEKEPGIIASEPHIMRCECQNWARTDQSLIAKHHKNCAKYDPESDAAEIIHALIRGIECWASEEDGVHPECWKAYQTACYAIGLSHHIKHS